MTFWPTLLAFCGGAVAGGVWVALPRRRRASHPPGHHEDPVPAPFGFYWQVGESGMIRGNGKRAWGRLYLVEIGRTIDPFGTYEGRKSGDWPPVPRWSRTVDRERDLRRESIRLLEQWQTEAARVQALDDVRRRLGEQS